MKNGQLSADNFLVTCPNARVTWSIPLLEQGNIVENLLPLRYASKVSSCRSERIFLVVQNFSAVVHLFSAVMHMWRSYASIYVIILVLSKRSSKQLYTPHLFPWLFFRLISTKGSYLPFGHRRYHIAYSILIASALILVNSLFICSCFSIKVTRNRTVVIRQGFPLFSW